MVKKNMVSFRKKKNMTDENQLPLFVADFKNRRDANTVFAFVHAIFPDLKFAILQDEHGLILVIRGLPESVLNEWNASSTLSLSTMFRLTGLESITLTGMVCTAKATEKTAVAAVKSTLHRKRIYTTMLPGDTPTAMQRCDYVSVPFPDVLDVRTSSGGGAFYTLRPNPTLTLCFFVSQLLPLTDLHACTSTSVIVTNMTCHEFPPRSGRFSLKTTPSSFVVWGKYVHPQLAHLVINGPRERQVDVIDEDAFVMISSVTPSKTPVSPSPSPSVHQALRIPSTDTTVASRMSTPLPSPMATTYVISLEPPADLTTVESSAVLKSTQRNTAWVDDILADFDLPPLVCAVCAEECFEVCTACSKPLCYEHSKCTCKSSHKAQYVATFCVVCGVESIAPCLTCHRHLCGSHASRVCPAHTRIFDKCTVVKCQATSKMSCATCGSRYCLGHGNKGDCANAHQLADPNATPAPQAPVMSEATRTPFATAITALPVPAKCDTPATQLLATGQTPAFPSPLEVDPTPSHVDGIPAPKRRRTKQTADTPVSLPPTKRNGKRVSEVIVHDVALLRNTYVHAVINGERKTVLVVGGGASRILVTYDEAGMTQTRQLRHSQITLT